jgi:hypothetical protein
MSDCLLAVTVCSHTDQPNNGNMSTKKGTNNADGRCRAHGVNVIAHETQQATTAIAAVTQTPALTIPDSGAPAKDRTCRRLGCPAARKTHTPNSGHHGQGCIVGYDPRPGVIRPGSRTEQKRLDEKLATTLLVAPRNIRPFAPSA